MTNGRRKTCFVVMGFGEKTDFQSSPQRLLNLNRTYEDIIEPAVTECDVECIRADKVIHSTVIDKPMYEHLLGADLVIADLSTSNANAIYELGVRHALRPYTTIVIAEQGFKFPFDLNHLSILKYEHLGKEIGFREVMRMRGELKKRITVLLERKETDSPVFVFLPNLLGKSADAAEGKPTSAAAAPPQDDKSFAELMQNFAKVKSAVRKAEDWLDVVSVLNRLKKLQPDDPYIIQQLTLATYKSEQPTALLALKNAQAILAALSPATSSDAETVGLWGAIHKRLWEADKNAADLDTAIRAYARGYLIKNDYYNGINFAFLLDVRAALTSGDDRIADRVLARRTRDEVLSLCEVALASGALEGEAAFWVQATRVEALLGLGRAADADTLRQQLAEQQPRPAQWMIDSMDAQLAKLASYLAAG